MPDTGTTPPEWLVARRLIGAGMVTLIGLDATNTVPATVFFALALQRHHYVTPAASLAWELMDVSRMHAGGRYFWDPLAAASLTTPGVVRLRSDRDPCNR